MPTIPPFYRLASKTARAVQAYVRAAAVAGLPFCNVHAHRWVKKDEFPNVKLIIADASPRKGNPGNWNVHLHVLVSTTAAGDAGDEATRVANADVLVGSVFDLFFQGIVDTDNSKLADAITAAARASAVDSSNGTDKNLAAQALANADLVDFKCDYITFDPGVALGVNEEGTGWVDKLPLLLTVRAAQDTEPA